MFEGARVVTYWVCSRALTERKVNLGCTLQGQLHHLFESAENVQGLHRAVPKTQITSLDGKPNEDPEGTAHWNLLILLQRE